MNKKYCVIVDAYSSCSFLAAEFIARGYACIHVKSPGEKGEYYLKSFRPQDFDIIINDDNIELIMTMLSGLDVVCAVPGTDAAVLVADTIAARLGIQHNVTALSPARRFKDLMAERLATVHLPHIIHLKSANSDEIIAFANQGDHWPLVIKPADGGATEGLSICHNADEIKAAVYNLLHQKSFLGHHFTSALAQPFLEGREYIVNTVSCEGRHYISDIWESKKVHNGNIIYDYMELLPFEGAVQKSLSEYILKVVPALGVHVGPVHSEVMFTNKGPILIESNCRLMGLGIPPALQHEALAHTQISLTAEAYVDPSAFAKHTSDPYHLKKHMVCVLHQVPYHHAIVNEVGIKLIQQLSTFQMHKFSKQERLPKTVDLLTSPGWVLLMHEDRDVIEADIEKIRQIEREHLFHTQA